MPISKFAVQIAHALADYLSEDNTAMLPSAYHYGADNSAVLNPYTASNISQKAMGLVASGARGALVSFGFWSAPSKPSPSNYNTPATSSYLSVPGVEGVDRAIQMATHFGIIQTQSQGESLVEILKTESSGRRSDLINEHGFNGTDPANILENRITHADCEHILSFLNHKDRWVERTSGQRILHALKSFLCISDRELEDEKKSLVNDHIEQPEDRDETIDFEIVGSVHNTGAESYAPAEFKTPEKILLKIIYDKTDVLKKSLVNETIIHTQAPPSHYRRSTSSNNQSSSARSKNSTSQSNHSVLSPTSTSPLQFKFS